MISNFVYHYTCIFFHTHPCTHTPAHTPLHTHPSTHTCTHIPAHTPPSTHTPPHTPAHTPLHAHPCTHTPLHTPAFPPTPSRPVILRVGSSWVTFGWSEPLCDGGHRIVSFNIQYYEQTSSFFTRVLRLVNKVAVSASQV